MIKENTNADIKLSGTEISTESPPKASSPSSAQDIEQALPCNTPTATQSKAHRPCLQIHSIPALHPSTAPKTTQLPGWGLCLSRGSGACCNPPALTALLSAGLLLPGTHGSAPAILHNPAPKSLPVRGNCPRSALGLCGCSACSPYPLPLVYAK